MEYFGCMDKTKGISATWIFHPESIFATNRKANEIFSSKTDKSEILKQPLDKIAGKTSYVKGPLLQGGY